MTRTLNVVGVSGSLQAPSRTIALVDEILAAFGRSLPIESHRIGLDELGPSLAGVLQRRDLPPAVELELKAIERADLLVVASPVYRASFTGLFKHLFDFVDQYALVDTPVLIAATGGSERHALILEHQMRPLFGFFQALTLPVGVYAHDSDFTDYLISAPLLNERIEKAIVRGLPLIRSNIAERERIALALESGAAEEDYTIPEDARTPVRLFS